MDGSMFRGIGEAIEFLFHAAIFLFLTLIASLFIIGLSFTSLYSPWLLLAYVVSTSLFVALRVTVLNTN